MIVCPVVLFGLIVVLSVVFYVRLLIIHLILYYVEYTWPTFVFPDKQNSLCIEACCHMFASANIKWLHEITINVKNVFPKKLLLLYLVSLYQIKKIIGPHTIFLKSHQFTVVYMAKEMNGIYISLMFFLLVHKRVS